MAQQHAIDRALKALRDEEETTALNIGRGKVGKDGRDERIGYVKGLQKAIELVTAAAKPDDEEDEQDGRSGRNR